MDEAGKRLAVSDYLNNVVYLVDTEAGSPTLHTQIAILPAGDYCLGVWVSSADSRVWASNYTTSTVTTVNTSTGLITKQIALGRSLTPALSPGKSSLLWTDGLQIRFMEIPNPVLPLPRLVGQEIFNPQDYIEQGLKDLAQVPYEGYVVSGFTTTDNPNVPYARAIKTETYNYIIDRARPVQRGARIYGEVWVMRPLGAPGAYTGTAYLGVQQFDRNMKPINNNKGTVYFAAAAYDTPADGAWHKLSAEYTLPLTHTPFNDSDGGPVCYVKGVALCNYNASIAANTPRREMQMDGIVIRYAGAPVSIRITADHATTGATIALGTGSFSIPLGATAATVQANVRALGGSNALVIVTGGVTDGSGSYTLTWPAGIIPAAMEVTSPTGVTWFIGQGAIDAATLNSHPDSYFATADDLALKAPLASPAFTGDPTAPTQTPGDNSTKLATTAYADTAIAALVNSAPGTLDTLGELAVALAADESTAAALATTVAGKVPKSVVDAKGDLIVATGPDAVGRLPVGSDGQVPYADSTQTAGLRWGDPAGAASAHESTHTSGGADAFLSTDLLEAAVKRIEESSGPTTLTVGAIADGEFLMRSGATLVSGTPASSSARSSLSATTASLAPGATDASLTPAFGRSGYLLSVMTDVDAWVRVYRTPADRTADAARSMGTDPAYDAGVLSDVICTGGVLYLLNRPRNFADMKVTPDGTLSIAVTNLSASNQTITIMWKKLTLES